MPSRPCGFAIGHLFLVFYMFASMKQLARGGRHSLIVFLILSLSDNLSYLACYEREASVGFLKFVLDEQADSFEDCFAKNCPKFIGVFV